MSFIPEKMNSIERALIAAASMAPSDARNVLRLICEGGMTTTVALNEPSEGDRHYAKREKFIKRMKSSTDRVCDYARHETLRNIEKHFRENPQHIKSAEGADESKPSSLAARLTFDRSSFSEELLAALAEDQAAALQTSGQQLFDEIGRDSVWRLPSHDAIQFIEDRANLLTNVPDEIHAQIMDSIEQGFANGESRKDLMERISTAFDEIGKGRAETIANTETAAAFNYARDKAMREAGVTHKRWLHSQSPLIKDPRPTHLEADGQVQPIDDPFDVGGVQFMRPADDSLGAGPEDIINCHCVAIPVEAPIESGEGDGHPFRGNQYTTVASEKTNPEFQSVVHEELKNSLKDFPEVYDSIGKVDFTRGDVGSAEALGAVLGNKHNPGRKSEMWFSNFLSSNAPDADISHISGTYNSGLRYTVRHESTHLIWDYIRSRTPETEREALYDFAKSAPKVSEYAKSNPLEAVAEVGSKVLSGEGSSEDLKWWSGLKQRYSGVKGKKLLK